MKQDKDMRLEEARQEIDRIDKAMLGLFEERMVQARKVAEYKRDHGLAIYDADREDEKIRRQTQDLEDPSLQSYYADFLRQTMRISRSYQAYILEGMKVAYSGIEGAFAYIASEKAFPSAEKQAHPDFASAYQAVVNSEADVAILPLENSSAGEVGQVTDLIFSGPLYINGTFELTVNQDLVSLPGAKLTDIKQVISHPQALTQCQDFIEKHNLEAIASENTALAAQEVAKREDPTLAAIASEDTAELYGLDILASGINTAANNTTRFAILSAQENKASSKNRDNQFILMFTVKNEAGSLARALNIIGSYGYNLRVLRSRPMKELMWEYYFYVEAEGNIHTGAGSDMMEALLVCCNNLKLVGSFIQ